MGTGECSGIGGNRMLLRVTSYTRDLRYGSVSNPLFRLYCVIM